MIVTVNKIAVNPLHAIKEIEHENMIKASLGENQNQI